MRRWFRPGTVMLALVTALIPTLGPAGCAQGPGREPTAGAARGFRQPLYNLDQTHFKAVGVLPDAKGSTRFRVQAGETGFWINRSHLGNGRPAIEFAQVSPDGEFKLPFAPVDVQSTTWVWQTVHWLAAGDRVLVAQEDWNNQTHQPVYKYVQLYPPPRRDLVTTDRLTLVGARAGTLYGYSNFETLYLLDPDLRTREKFTVKGGVGTLAPIGKDRLLIGNSPFDLTKRDFVWDAAGVNKESYPAIAGWQALATDGTGQIWVARWADARKLRLTAVDATGQVRADKVVGPHELSEVAGVGMLALPDRLVVAGIGTYQGQEHLLIYSVPAR